MAKKVLVLIFKLTRFTFRHILKYLYTNWSSLAFRALWCIKAKRSTSFSSLKIDNKKLNKDIYVFEKKVRRKESPENGLYLQQDYYVALIRKINPEYRFVAWSEDPKSKYIWDNSVYFTDISLTQCRPFEGDIKRSWELSRFTDAFIHVSNGNLDEISCRVIDFLTSQTPFYGVHWKCAMDVGIRAMNLILVSPYIRQYIKDSRLNTQEKKRIQSLFDTSLQQHFLYILTNIEYIPDGKSNNHLLANISSLVCLSAYFNLKVVLKASRYLLNKVAVNQFNNDGINFESSLPYHKLSNELLIWAMLIDWSYCDTKNTLESFIKQRYNKELFDRIERINLATKRIISPNFDVPNVGDNDSGFIVKLDELPPNKQVLFVSLYDYILDGEESLYCALKNDCFKKNTHPPKGVYNFTESGLIVVNKERVFLVINYGGEGQNGNCGHDHSDRLSFEFWVDGSKIVTDRGTFCYTSSEMKRNLYRHSRSHNLPQFKKDVQFENRGLFSRKMISHAKFNKLVELGNGNIMLSFSLLDENDNLIFERLFEVNVNYGSLIIEDSYGLSEPEYSIIYTTKFPINSVGRSRPIPVFSSNNYDSKCLIYKNKYDSNRVEISYDSGDIYISCEN